MDHILRSKLFTHYHRQCAKEEPILLPPRIEQFYTILENEPPLRRSSEKAVNEMEHEGNGQQEHQHGHHLHHRSQSTSSTTTTSSNGGAERELRAAAAASLDPLSDSASDYNALAAGHNHNTTTTTTTTSPPPLHTITTTNVMMNSTNGDGRQNGNNNNATMTVDDGTTTSSRGDGEGRSHVYGAPDTDTRPATAATTAAVGGVRVVDDPLAFPREDSLNAPLPGAGGNNANSSSSNMSTATMTLPRALPCPEDSTAGAHTISNNSLTQAGCNNNNTTTTNTTITTTNSNSNAMHVTGQKVTTTAAGGIVEHRGAQGAPRPHRRPQGELLSLFDQSPEARAELRRRRKEQLRAQINHPEAPVIVQIAAKDRALCTLGTTLTDYVNSVVDLRTQRVQKGLADLTQVGTVVYAGLPTTPYSPSESSTNNNNNNNANTNTKSAMSEKERAGGGNEKEKKRKAAKDAAANGHPCYNGLYAKYPSSRKGKKADKQQQQMLLSRQMPLYDAASPVTFEELREHPLLLTRPRRQARWAGVVHGRVSSEEMYGQPVPYHTNNNTAEQESSSNNNNNDAMTGQLMQNTYHHNYYYDARADTTGRMSEAYIAPQSAQGYEGGMRSSSSCVLQGNLTTTTTPPLLSSCYYYNSNSTYYYSNNNNNYGTGTSTGGLYAPSEAAAMPPSRQNTNTTTATTPITTTTTGAGSTMSSTLMMRMMMSGTTLTTTPYNNNSNSNNYTNMTMPSQSMTHVPNTAHSNNNNGSSNNTPMYVGTVCTAVPTTIGRPIATLAQPPVQTQSNKAAYNTTSTSTSSSNVCNVSGWPQMSTAACSCSWSALTLSTQSLSSAQQPTQTQQQAAAAAATVAGYPALSLQYQSAGQSVAPRPSLTPEGYAVYLSA